MTLWQSANPVRAVGASLVILSPTSNVFVSLSSVMVFPHCKTVTLQTNCDSCIQWHVGILTQTSLEKDGLHLVIICTLVLLLVPIVLRELVLTVVCLPENFDSFSGVADASSITAERLPGLTVGFEFCNRYSFRRDSTRSVLHLETFACLGDLKT